MASREYSLWILVSEYTCAVMCAFSLAISPRVLVLSHPLLSVHRSVARPAFESGFVFVCWLVRRWSTLSPPLLMEVVLAVEVEHHTSTGICCYMLQHYLILLSGRLQQQQRHAASMCSPLHQVCWPTLFPVVTCTYHR